MSEAVRGGRSPRIPRISNADQLQRRSDREFLPHVEGLRAVAVLAVLWAHGGPISVSIASVEAQARSSPLFQGGFTGVDVFFVISGFLITGLLLREHDATGRINLRQFYARRMRRILPAVLATIALTVVVSLVLLAPLEVPDISLDGAASALSLGNVHFALESTDYFSATEPSPFRHLWSLGVEEQFYLIWPALLIVVLRILRARWALAAGIAAMGVASFVFGLWLTEAFDPYAFYSLPSRLWELALGGLVAISAGWLARVPRRFSVPIGWVGVALVASGFILLDDGTPFPGAGALLPTFGAVALIVGGSQTGPVHWVLTRPPMRFIGRISYSLYLWHWPILVLPSLAIGDSLPQVVRLALGVVSVAVAAVSWRLIEEPFRRGRFWNRRPRLVLATALSTAIAVAVFTIGVGDYSVGRVAALETVPPIPPSAAVGTPGYAESGATGQSSSGPSIAPSAVPNVVPTVVPNPRPLPADIRPELTLARSDKERIVADGCFMGLPGSQPPDCVYGNRDGTFMVALVGDSHASQWFPAVEQIAVAHGWRLVTFAKASCVFVDLPIFSPLLKREYTECEAWRPQVVQRLIAEQPDLVIVSSNRWLPPVNQIDEDPTRQGEAMARLLRQIPGQIAILADTPAAAFDVPVCLSGHLDDITRCATPRLAAFGRQHLVRERAAATAARATLIDLSDAVCPDDQCQPVVRGMIVYRDDQHLTATFAASLAGLLESMLPIPR